MRVSGSEKLLYYNNLDILEVFLIEFLREFVGK